MNIEARLEAWKKEWAPYTDLVALKALEEIMREARAEAIHECAKICGAEYGTEPRHREYIRAWQDACDTCETKIRALLTKGGDEK